MNQPTQLHLVFRLNELRNNINAAKDKELMIAFAQEAYDLSFPVPADPSFNYKIEGKQRTLTLLANEIRIFEKSSSELPVIQFQLASTILMLSLQFIEGSLGLMQKMLRDFQKLKAA